MLRLSSLLVPAALLVPASADAADGWSTAPIAGMTTHVYTPPGTSAIGDGRALLVALHGCIQTAANLRDQGTFANAAETTGTVIALPEVPGGGVVAGCWDYYGPDHDRQSRHDDDLLALVDALLADPALAIDPDQVYLAGLSSGAGEAAVMGCLAPDVFAGIGIAAGPAVGTAQSDISFVSTTPELAGSVCTALAGANAQHFATQQVAVIAGTLDYTVAQDYARVHAEMFAALYGGPTSAPLDVTMLPGAMPQGTGEAFADAGGPRIARVSMQGVGHAWPTGTGQGYELYFVSPGGFDFAMFLAQWFQAGNRRVDGAPADAGSDAGGSTSDAGDSSGGDGTTSDAGTTGDAALDGGAQGCACGVGGERWGGTLAVLGVAAGLPRRRRRPCKRVAATAALR